MTEWDHGYLTAVNEMNNYLSGVEQRAVNQNSEEYYGVHFAIGLFSFKLREMMKKGQS